MSEDNIDSAEENKAEDVTQEEVSNDDTVEYRHLSEEELAKAHKYWGGSLKIVGVILAIWFFVSYGCGILFKSSLDSIKIGNAPLGFWMAQQGSIICFVLLLIAYMIFMNKLDAKYGYDEGDDS